MLAIQHRIHVELNSHVMPNGNNKVQLGGHGKSALRRREGARQRGEENQVAVTDQNLRTFPLGF